MGRIMRISAIVVYRRATGRDHLERLTEGSLRLDQLHTEVVMRAQLKSLVPRRVSTPRRRQNARRLAPQSSINQTPGALTLAHF